MLSFKEVQHIATLARIGLTDKEVLQFQKDLASVLEYFEILRDVDTVSRGASSTVSTPMPFVRTRKDIAKPKNAKEGQRLIALAPKTKDSYLKVQSIL